MGNADASERKWACVAVSNIIQNDPSTRRLLQGKNVVGALITRLSDSEEEVVVEAAGALRYERICRHGVVRILNRIYASNLCIDGGYDICGEMYNKNILAPLRTFIPKVSVASGTSMGKLLTVDLKISTMLSQYLEDPKSAPENAKTHVYEFAENVITILWCLS